MRLSDLLICCCCLGTSLNSVTEARRIQSDPSPKVTQITIDAVNEDTASLLCVNCWSGSGQHDQHKCFTADEPAGTISWNFQPNIFTIFWCTARWGLARLKGFPVFGEGVPRTSSSWLIDGLGIRRTMEDGRPVNDFFLDWPGLSFTTPEEQWPTTEEEL